MKHIGTGFFQKQWLRHPNKERLLGAHSTTFRPHWRTYFWEVCNWVGYSYLCEYVCQDTFSHEFKFGGPNNGELRVNFWTVCFRMGEKEFISLSRSTFLCLLKEIRVKFPLSWLRVLPICGNILSIPTSHSFCFGSRELQTGPLKSTTGLTKIFFIIGVGRTCISTVEEISNPLKMNVERYTRCHGSFWDGGRFCTTEE